MSLSLELLSFYLYQSMAGSLYSELAAIVGAFMLGLAVGTYGARRANSPALAYPALALMGAAVVIFLLSYDAVRPSMLLVYHVLFQFTVAIATGTLFVAATVRYYPDREDRNRGAGYAFELVGSAFGALLTTSVLLPVIGVQWLLLAICGILLLGLAGTFLAGTE